MTRASRQRRVVIYVDENEGEPFIDWVEGLKDRKNRARILRRVDRLEDGNFGDYKAVGEGVLELRLFFGSGFRVYCAEDGDVLIVLLCGGDKKTQGKDIKKAINYWTEYKRRKNE